MRFPQKLLQVKQAQLSKPIFIGEVFLLLISLRTFGPFPIGPMSFPCWGPPSWCSVPGEVPPEQRGRIPSVTLLTTLLWIQPRMPAAFWAVSETPTGLGKPACSEMRGDPPAVRWARPGRRGGVALSAGTVPPGAAGGRAGLRLRSAPARPGSCGGAGRRGWRRARPPQRPGSGEPAAVWARSSSRRSAPGNEPAPGAALSRAEAARLPRLAPGGGSLCRPSVPAPGRRPCPGVPDLPPDEAAGRFPRLVHFWSS